MVIKIKPTVIPVSFQFLEVSSLARQKPTMQVDKNSIQNFVVDFFIIAKFIRPPLSFACLQLKAAPSITKIQFELACIASYYFINAYALIGSRTLVANIRTAVPNYLTILRTAWGCYYFLNCFLNFSICLLCLRMCTIACSQICSKS